MNTQALQEPCNEHDYTALLTESLRNFLGDESLETSALSNIGVNAVAYLRDTNVAFAFYTRMPKKHRTDDVSQVIVPCSDNVRVYSEMHQVTQSM